MDCSREVTGYYVGKNGDTGRVRVSRIPGYYLCRVTGERIDGITVDCNIFRADSLTIDPEGTIRSVEGWTVQLEYHTDIYVILGSLQTKKTEE